MKKAYVFGTLVCSVLFLVLPGAFAQEGCRSEQALPSNLIPFSKPLQAAGRSLS